MNGDHDDFVAIALEALAPDDRARAIEEIRAFAVLHQFDLPRCLMGET